MQPVAGGTHPLERKRSDRIAGLFRSGDLAQAQALALREVQEIEGRHGLDSIKLIPVLIDLAEVQKAAGKSGEAIPTYQRVLLLLQGLDDTYLLERAHVHNSLGVLLSLDGKYRQAQAHLREAVQIRSSSLGRSNPKTAISHLNLGIALSKSALYQEAEAALGQALQVFDHDPGSVDNHVVTLDAFAALYRATGDYRRAELFYKRALDLTAKGRPAARAGLLNGLGTLYTALGDYQLAEDKLLAAEKIARSDARQQVVLAESLNNLAVVYQRRGNFEQAESKQREGLRILEAAYGQSHPQALQALYNLGVVQYRKGSLLEAKQSLERVLAQQIASDTNSLALTHTWNALAGVDWADGANEVVERYLQKALQQRRRILGDSHPDVAMSETNLAIYHAGTGSHAQSLKHFSASTDIDHGLLEHVLGFTTEERKLKYLAKKNDHLYALLSLVTKHLPESQQARSLALDAWLKRKGMILEAQRRYREALVNRDESAAVRLLQELAAARADLSRLVFSARAWEGRREVERRMSELEDRVDALESRLSTMSPSYAAIGASGEPSASRVAGRLPENAVLVEIARFDRFRFSERDPRKRWGESEYVAFILRPEKDAPIEMVPLGNARKLEEQLEDMLYTMLDSSSAEEVNGALRTGYEVLFAPLQLGIPAGTKEIWLSPDGMLNLIPFEILYGDGNRFLVQDYLFVYLSTGRDLLRTHRQQASESKSVLMGDPNFDLEPDKKGSVLRKIESKKTRRSVQADLRRAWELNSSDLSFSQLPATLVEVEAIREVLGPENVGLYVGEAALEEILYGLHRPRILHLATHGFFLSNLKVKDQASSTKDGRRELVRIQNPLLKSGLVFAGANRSLKGQAQGQDGILTAEEILGLELRGTELVVLSACQTGLGEVVNGEGVYGLRRSFIAAGTQGLIMSLWEVANDETKELMVDFYDQFQNQQNPPRVAMQKARLKMMDVVRKRYGYAHPFYWGAFVYQGLPQ